MRKHIVLYFVLLFFIMSVLAGCQLGAPSEESKPPESVSLINPLGPTVIPVTGITSDAVKDDVTVNISNWKNNDEALGLLASNQTDFAVLPVSMAANMYASNVEIELLGVHEWKVFYLVARNEVNFEGWSSLLGKTLYSPISKGQTVDILTRYALSREKIKPDEEVLFQYAPPQEIVALFESGKVDYAALPEPFATLAVKKGGKIVLDYQEYWGEATGYPARIPVAGLFVRKDFKEQYPDTTATVARLFSESTAWANNNVDKAIEAAGDTLSIPAPVMKASLQRVEFNYIPVAEAKKEVQQYLVTINNVYSEALKQLPDAGFYGE